MMDPHQSAHRLFKADCRLKAFRWLLASQMFLQAMPAVAQDMVFPGAEWEITTPESVMIDSQLLQQALDRSPDRGQRYIIVRNGRVIALPLDPFAPGDPVFTPPGIPGSLRSSAYLTRCKCPCTADAIETRGRSPDAPVPPPRLAPESSDR